MMFLKSVSVHIRIDRVNDNRIDIITRERTQKNCALTSDLYLSRLKVIIIKEVYGILQGSLFGK